MKILLGILGLALIAGAGWSYKNISEVDSLKDQCLARLEAKTRIVIITIKGTAFTSAEKNKIETFASSLPNVKKAEYLSPEDVLANYKSQHVGDAQVNAQLAELNGNPFLGILKLSYDSGEHANAAREPVKSPLENQGIKIDFVSTYPTSLVDSMRISYERANPSLLRKLIDWKQYKKTMQEGFEECVKNTQGI